MEKKNRLFSRFHFCFFALLSSPRRLPFWLLQPQCELEASSPLLRVARAGAPPGQQREQ